MNCLAGTRANNPAVRGLVSPSHAALRMDCSGIRALKPKFLFTGRAPYVRVSVRRRGLATECRCYVANVLVLKQTVVQGTRHGLEFPTALTTAPVTAFLHKRR
jgi:hypothetical protein